MKRLFAILTLCAATAAAAGLGANPAAADGRGDSRQYRQESLSDRDHGRSDRRYQRGKKHQWARNPQRKHHKVRRHHRRHRHTLGYYHRPGHGQGYGHQQDRGKRYGHRRGHAQRYRYVPGPYYALRFDGRRVIFRFDRPAQRKPAGGPWNRPGPARAGM